MYSKAVSQSVLKINKLNKIFGTKHAVRNVSLELKPGEIYGFLGPNGAGKTTTIRLIMGFAMPSSGDITLFNKYKSGSPTALEEVGFLSADSVFYGQWDSRQHINFVASLRGGKDYAIKLAKEFNLDLQTKYHRLSSGNKQKLGLVLALMSQPKLLVLDEPIRGLDPILQDQLHSTLQDSTKNGTTIFMSSHDLGEVERICNRVGLIKNGKLVASETMSTLRRLQIHEVRVIFNNKVRSQTFVSDNVELIEEAGNKLTLHVKGDVSKLLGKLSRHQLTDISISHLSLEDVFMRYYK